VKDNSKSFSKLALKLSILANFCGFVYWVSTSAHVYSYVHLVAYGNNC